MKDYSNLHVERLEAELFEREFKRRNYKKTQSRGGKRVMPAGALDKTGQCNRMLTFNGTKEKSRAI